MCISFFYITNKENKDVTFSPNFQQHTASYRGGSCAAKKKITKEEQPLAYTPSHCHARLSRPAATLSTPSRHTLKP